MSGFFSLGGGSGSGDRDHEQHHQQTHTNNNSSLLLFKNNEDIYNKGFELWQQYYQLHQQRLHSSSSSSHHTIQDVDFSVGPSRRNNDNNIFINNNNIGDESLSPNYNSYSNFRSGAGVAGFRVMRQGGGRGGSSEGMNCQDCGNQAKKDCIHMRCRTCCKSRGFQCSTHVKSTWVPAAKRRERQQQLASLQNDQIAVRGDHQNLQAKRLRENLGGGGASSTLACATTSRFPATTSGFELGHFPPEVNTQAVFRCVRMSGMDDQDEQLAYKTAVSIGGHIFKGTLYDHGPESRYSGGAGESSSHQQQPLGLIGGPSTTGSAPAATTGVPGVSILDPSIYPAPLNAFMAGTQFFPPPRP